LLLYKFSLKDEVKIAQEDIAAFQKSFGGEMPTILTQLKGKGRDEVISFRLIGESEGRKLAERQRTEGN
jgi:hypothetical protein